jgi:hypothetical protein
MRRSHNHAGTRARTSAATARRRRHVECLVGLHTIAPKELPVSRERRSAVRLEAARAPGPTAACARCSDMSFVLNRPAITLPMLDLLEPRRTSQLHVDAHEARHAGLPGSRPRAPSFRSARSGVDRGPAAQAAWARVRTGTMRGAITGCGCGGGGGNKASSTTDGVLHDNELLGGSSTPEMKRSYLESAGPGYESGRFRSAGYSSKLAAS